MRVPNAGTVLGVIALGIAGVSVAAAAIPDSAGNFTGCFDANGTFRLIDAEAGANCQPFETKVTWPSIPRPGATGPTGPAGNPGPDGGDCVTNPASPFGVAKACVGADADPTVPKQAGVYDTLRTTDQLSKAIAARAKGTLTATCLPGDVRVGREVIFDDVSKASSPLVTVLEDRPTQSGQGWTFRVANDSGEKITMKLKVRCARKAFP